MQAIATAEERRAKMAQQRQLALGRQRNAVLTGLGVMANRDLPTGSGQMQALQQKQALKNLLAPAYEPAPQQVAQRKPGTESLEFQSVSHGPMESANQGQPDTGRSGVDGVEVFRLGTPLKRPEGLETPVKPAGVDAGLWNLQGESPAEEAPSDRAGSKRSWKPWKGSPAKPQAETVPEGVDEDGVVAFSATDPLQDVDTAWSVPDAPSGGDRGYPAEGGLANSLTAIAVAPQTLCSVEETAVVEAVEAISSRPQSPVDGFEQAPKFRGPQKVAASGPPPFGGVDPLEDSLQELMMPI